MVTFPLKKKNTTTKHLGLKGTSEGHPVQPYVWSRTNFKVTLGCLRLLLS